MWLTQVTQQLTCSVQAFINKVPADLIKQRVNITNSELPPNLTLRPIDIRNSHWLIGMVYGGSGINSSMGPAGPQHHRG